MRRYKISTEVLMLILEKLDPQSLWRACRAFTRIYNVVMEFQSLRYRFELALAAMKDGHAPRAHVPPLARYQLLLSYKKDWPRLHWSHECKMQIPASVQLGVSGGFLHKLFNSGGQTCLELSELPSYRAGRPMSKTRHIRYSAPMVDSVVIDPSQRLLIMSYLFSQNGMAAIQVHIRDLWTFSRHPWAPAMTCEFSTQCNLRVTSVTLQICGSKFCITISFAGDTVKHLIMDWRTLHARWFDEKDIHFLNDSSLLVIRKHHSRAMLNLYNITDIANLTNAREYEIPEAWAHSSFAFIPNASPRHDSGANPDAVFYPDPSQRLLGISIAPAQSAKGSPFVWLFINENYFRIPTRRDPATRVSWAHWGSYTAMRVVNPSPCLRAPQLSGSRLVYVDADATPVSRSRSSVVATPRLNLIDFQPFLESGAGPTKAWTIGSRTEFVPVESTKAVPSTTVDNSAIYGVRLNEDNIILLLEQQGMRSVNILTFGAPETSRSSRHGHSHRPSIGH
ncbi:hypothetical protein HGRIS_005039 [Hohenbuehelia grisea]|uniref:F-box domain-containing protein n=1 Tax=Hohenbuehelia grisea TaxID=104357 RepID=A0ABR3JDU0_9AGAR